MTDKEAMQMALDALETVTAKMLECRDELAEYGGRPKTISKQLLWDSSQDAYVDAAIPAAEAIRARLAQGEQEPYGYLVRRNWKEPRFVEAGNVEGVPNLPFNNPEYQPLYTSQPQRGWQSLTDDDIEDACWTEVDQRLRSFARAIEAALREKNT